MGLIYNLIVAVITVALIVILTYFLNAKFKQWEDEETFHGDKPRPLNDDEIIWMVDYFHNKEDAPDLDGYMGQYHLPKAVMKAYEQKHGRSRKWM